MSETIEMTVPYTNPSPIDELLASKKKINKLRIALTATTVTAIAALVYFKVTERIDEAADDDEAWVTYETPETEETIETV